MRSASARPGPAVAAAAAAERAPLHQHAVQPAPPHSAPRGASTAPRRSPQAATAPPPTRGDDLHELGGARQPVAACNLRVRGACVRGGGVVPRPAAGARACERRATCFKPHWCAPAAGPHVRPRRELLAVARRPRPRARARTSILSVFRLTSLPSRTPLISAATTCACSVAAVRWWLRLWLTSPAGRLSRHGSAGRGAPERSTALDGEAAWRLRPPQVGALLDVSSIPLSTHLGDRPYARLLWGRAHRRRADRALAAAIAATRLAAERRRRGRRVGCRAAGAHGGRRLLLVNYAVRRRRPACRRQRAAGARAAAAAAAARVRRTGGLAPRMQPN